MLNKFVFLLLRSYEDYIWSYFFEHSRNVYAVALWIITLGKTRWDPDIGSSIKSCTIKLKTKCKKKGRWSCRLMTTWHTYNNKIVNLFVKKFIQNLHFYSRYGIFHVQYPWFWWQPNILKISTEMVLCPSIPLQRFVLLQAVYMILKCPLNNLICMTPYLEREKTH